MCACAGIAAVKTIMLQAASQRGLLTAERMEAALKDGADLHQVLGARPVCASDARGWNDHWSGMEVFPS